MSVQCFLVEPSGRAKRYLRRYVIDIAKCCSGEHRYHNAQTYIDVVEERKDEEGYISFPDTLSDFPPSDARWPAKCEACEYVFTPGDSYQIYHDSIYLDAQGAEHSLHDKTPGMMWDAWWMGAWGQGPDGKALIVICPDGNQWMIDGPASNCTDPADTGPYETAHRCWCRSGTPPLITVGKSPGKTCAAGGGSIQTGGYHGHLINGVFT